jgi:hypothetical protein
MTAERTRSVVGEDAVREIGSTTADPYSTTNIYFSVNSDRPTSNTIKKNAHNAVLLAKAQFKKPGAPLMT